MEQVQIFHPILLWVRDLMWEKVGIYDSESGGGGWDKAIFDKVLKNTLYVSL